MNATSIMAIMNNRDVNTRCALNSRRRGECNGYLLSVYILSYTSYTFQKSREEERKGLLEAQQVLAERTQWTQKSPLLAPLGSSQLLPNR
jgi:hypothetical protein